MSIKSFKELYDKSNENVDNSEDFLQNNFQSQKYDYDYILAEMKSKHGWGDLNHDKIEDFEKSDYCKTDLISSDDDYVKHFNMYMKDLSQGLAPEFEDKLNIEIANETPDISLEEYEETIKKEDINMETNTDTDIEYDLPANSACKILIINSCEGENENCTEALKDNLDCDCKEINLYQLNIKDSKSEEEPKDGMDLIYKEIEGCDAIVFACDGNSMKTCIDRMCNHYKEGELKNMIFGAIFNSDSESNKELINCAINDLKMIVNGDCICTEGDETSTDATNMALCLTNLCNSTISLRDTARIETEEVVDDEIQNYGEFVDEHQIEDPHDSSLEDDLPEPGTEEHDTFIDDLKGEVSRELDMPFSGDEDKIEDVEEEEEEGEEEEKKDKNEVSGKTVKGKDKEEVERANSEVSADGPQTVSRPKPTEEGEEEAKTEEEEERLIYNLDGTITDISKDDTDTNRAKGNPQAWKKAKVDEEEEVIVNKPNTDYAIPFSMFDDAWEKYEESKSEKTFDEYIKEYHYNEWDNVKEDEEELDIQEEQEVLEIDADVEDSLIDSMDYDQIIALLNSSQTLSMSEMERAHKRVKELEGSRVHGLVENEEEIEQEIVELEDDLHRPETALEEEDTANRDIDRMSYPELKSMIENEDSLSIDELERAITRISEIESTDDRTDDIDRFEEFMVDEYEEKAVAEEEEACKCGDDCDCEDCKAKKEAVEEEEEEVCECGEDCDCEDCKCKKEEKQNENSVSKFNDFK